MAGWGMIVRMNERFAGMVWVAVLAMAVGCAEPTPHNPSFPVTMEEARSALREMAVRPAALRRPVLVIGGYCDPGVSTAYLKHEIRKLTGDDRVVTAVVGFCQTFDECRQKAIEAVDRAYPNGDPQWTTEVDVIGASLGGLVGRYAAAPSRDPQHPRRLRIARLFTIASPHSGAVLTKTATLTRLQADMRPRSEFLKYVGGCDAQAGYELFAYARLGDGLVGERYAAPAGQNPLWVGKAPLEGGHMGAWHDARILADIARRLRGERALSTKPAAALPGG